MAWNSFKINTKRKKLTTKKIFKMRVLRKLQYTEFSNL